MSSANPERMAASINANFASFSRFAMIGLNLKTTPIEDLEKIALTNDEISHFYELLGNSSQHQESANLQDTFIVSTCNRTEIYSLPGEEIDCTSRLINTLQDVVGKERFPEKAEWYRKFGFDGLQHLFRVTCGLDSMIIGEAQVLGQIKDAIVYRQSSTETSGTFDTIARHALKAAKESRARTQIGAGAVSIASAAVQLCQRIYSDLSKQKVVVIGAGDTGRLVAQHFEQKGAGTLMIVNRNNEKGESLAKQVQGHFIPFEKLEHALEGADIVVSAIQTESPIINKELLIRARSSENSPLALIDLGLPRNIATDVNDRSNTFVHDITALGQVVDHNLALRKKEIPFVEEIIQGEINKLRNWQNQLNATPFILTLREAIDKIRTEELAKHQDKLTPEAQETLNTVTRAIVNKIMHGPMLSIKSYARQAEDGLERLEIVRDLFRHLEEQEYSADGQGEDLSDTQKE
tara:strand:- start:5832 stop:7223 length:1392 start_codon:yes stop_codon:yes gene_type:complete